MPLSDVDVMRHATLFFPNRWRVSFDRTARTFLSASGWWGRGRVGAEKGKTDCMVKKVENSELWYVYTYRAPNEKLPFYVGKGEDLRVFSHASGNGSPETNRQIKLIRDTGKEPVIEIVARGLSEETAYAVEMALIEFIGLENLTNKQHGRGYLSHGKINADRLEAYLVGECVNPNDFKDMPTIIFRINKLYKPKMSKGELYDVTRCCWKVDLDKARECKYAMAAYQGRIVAIYDIVDWYAAGTTFMLRDQVETDEGRKEFVGRECKTKAVRKKFLGKSISRLPKYGSRREFLYYGV